MRAWPVAVAVLALAASAEAHEFRPAILDLTDLGEGRYEVRFEPPSAGGESAGGVAESAPVLPEGCRRLGDGVGSRFVADCGPSGLAGRVVHVRGLGSADALVRFHGEGGTVTAVLRADAPAFTVPAGLGSRLSRARGYFGAGVEHILRGPDHLLFVLGLLLLVRGVGGAWGGGRRGRSRGTRERYGVPAGASSPAGRTRLRPPPSSNAALVRTITAFTLAHSLTLALAVLGAVRLPPAPVEAVIALSLLVLAGELCRPPAGEARLESLARRRPFLLAFSFGLLHGFGFAGGLADLRVPGADLPLALGLFNLGVEAGQLAFVAVALAAAALLRRASPGPRLAKIPAYAIGTLASFWLFERLSRLWN